MHFLLIGCIIDVIWSDIANFFQTLGGYEEVAREFEPIKQGEMFWMNYRHYTSYLKKSISFGLPRFCVLDKSKAFNCSIPFLHVQKKISVLFFRLGQYWSKQSLLWIRNLTSGQGSIKKDFREGCKVNETNSKLEVVWTTVIQFFSYWHSMSMFLHLRVLSFSLQSACSKLKLSHVL